jgi:hypothetical protein
MTMPSERWVPKVHPVTRGAEPDDPLDLHATAVPGYPEVMLRYVAQEYGWMGLGLEDIAALFRNPGYPVLYALWRHYGEAGLRERLAAALGRTGVFRFQETVREESEEPRPDLIQLSVRTSPKRQRGEHTTSPLAGASGSYTVPAKPEGSSHAERL